MSVTNRYNHNFTCHVDVALIKNKTSHPKKWHYHMIPLVTDHVGDRVSFVH